MKTIKIFFSILIVLSTSCGQQNLENRQNSQFVPTYNPIIGPTNITNPTVDARAIYESFPLPDFPVVVANLMGSTTSQRQYQDEFCRKTGAVVPNPTYNYECWRKLSIGQQAYSQFNSINHTSGNAITIGNIVGVTNIEKINPGRTLLCQKITAVYPNAPSSYYCYSRM